MSSTTDSRAYRGQILVIFVLSLTALILFAALAFDTGQLLLERRDQQDAADAAALAGAYYLDGTATSANTARLRAADVATANGFTNGSGSTVVNISTPTDFRIEVVITDNRPSVFAGIMGVAGWDVSVKAVAVNENGVGAGFAMLALEPTECAAALFSGRGVVDSNGNIQVNSTCADSAFQRTGTSTVNVSADSACNVVGGIKDRGSGTLNCSTNSGADPIPDPLTGVAAPPKPDYPGDVGAEQPVNNVGATLDIPDGCPGGATAATEDNPVTCQFTSNYAGTTWRLYPGYYPGGIQLQAGTFYWEPGIYWIGGGGVTVSGNGTVSTSVATGGTTLDFGIMIYNTEDPYFHDECAAGTATDPATMCIQDISLNGASAQVSFWPLHDGSAWQGLLIFSDRTLSADVSINGSDSGTTDTRGTIYDPAGEVQVNGNGGTLNLDQVIANNFVINGGGGTINVLNDESFEFTFTAAGLIE